MNPPANHATREHAIIEYDGSLAVPDRLTRKAHGHYLAYAERMLAVYRTGVGRRRRDLHRDIHGLLAHEFDCPTRRIEAFCRLLDDASDFETDPRGRAADLRLRVFTMAAPFFPLVREPDRLFETSEAEAKARIAADLGPPWDEIEAALYADVIDAQPLKTFSGYPDAGGFLSRYNVAQVQACLYRAERMTVVATGDLKIIARYAKFARLLHEIRRVGPGQYKIIFTGPASVLHETRRYGVQFAAFIPALLACRGWSMEAIVQTPWRGKARLVLSEEDGLTSHLPPPEEFDSAVESEFAGKFGAARDGWTLSRETEIIHEGQSVFVPDFAFRHQDGSEVLLEIVGFWTPEYLAKKRETLLRFRDRPMLIAVAERHLRDGAAVPEDVIVYKTALKVEPVLAALDRFRARHFLHD